MSLASELGYYLVAAVATVFIRWVGGPVSNEVLLYFVLVVGARQVGVATTRQKVEVEVVNRDGESVPFDVRVN